MAESGEQNVNNGLALKGQPNSAQWQRLGLMVTNIP